MTETRTVRSGPRPLDLCRRTHLRALRTIPKFPTAAVTQFPKSRCAGSSGGWSVLRTVDKHSTGPAGTSHDPPL